MNQDTLVFSNSVTCFGMYVAALVEIEAMKAANAARELRGESPAYGEEAFRTLLEKYGMNY